MRPLVTVCVAIVAVLVGAFLAFWRANVVNELHFVPVDMKGKTVVITGATEGIGKESAKVLASWGANLILPVRTRAKGDKLKDKVLKEAAPGATITIYDGFDLADFATVRAFADKLSGQAIDVLMNNAGLAVPSVEETKDKIEIMYQVNHLGPFLLTHLLLPNFRKAKEEARVVLVSSAAHYTGSVGTHKYSLERRGMQESRPLQRYDDSKLMNVMAAKSFAERYGETGKITFNSVHPGFVMSNLDHNMPGPVAALVIGLRKVLGRTTRQGAMAQVTLATHPKLKGVNGRYFSDGCMNELCNTSCLYCDTNNLPGAVVNSEANDRKSRDWLWDVSMKLTGLSS